jgi:shikimate dehydrogenase
MPVKFGLIGKSLSHSFSRDFFTKKFDALGLTGYSYALYELPTISGIASLVAQNPELAGLNVTIPYKIAVLDYLTSVSHEVESIGAVNTVKITHAGDKTELRGFNTDAYGFEMSIKPFLESHHQRALVLGNGGASKAVQYVLKKIGIDFIVVSRSPDKNQLSYSDLNAYVLQHHLFVINTTPVGMSPRAEACLPLPFAYVNEKHFFVDLIYNPAETVFLREARKNGARILNGSTMLHLQAEKAWEIWNMHE